MSSEHDNYGIVVDSGSSGSRIQIYKWEDPTYTQKNSDDAKQLKSVPEIIQEESWTHKISPGLSSFADDPDDVWKDHFKPLIEYAEGIIPESKHSSTPIFIQATAGMRLVPEKKRNKVLKETCSALKKHSNFLIEDCSDHVQVIDGEVEGLYGWLGLNYLKGNLNNYDITLPESKHSSFGFMDMGGASTQIAFVPSDPKELTKHKEDLYSVKLRSVNGETQDWSIFVSTWLGFGANEARRRHLRNLILALPEGVNYDQDGDDKYDLIDPCSPNGMIIEQEHDGISYEITGSGDYKTCMKLIYPLLLKHLPCRDSPCLFNGVHAPTIDFKKDKFVGVSEYWYTANDVFNMGGAYNFLKFEEGLKDFCELEWSEIEQSYGEGKYGSNIKIPLLRDSCFKAAWVVNVLHEGFELPRIGFENVDNSEFEDPNHIPFQSANLIDGAELSWTLGKILLFASSQVPTQDKEPIGVIPAKTSNFISSSKVGGRNQHVIVKDQDSLSSGFFYLFMFSLLFSVSCLFWYYKKHNGRPFQPNKFQGISRLQVEKVINSVQQYQTRLRAALQRFYYQRLATSETAFMHQGNQANIQLEEGLGGSVDDDDDGAGDINGNSGRNFLSANMNKNNTTLRTRSSANLQAMSPIPSAPVQRPGLRNAVSLSTFPILENGPNLPGFDFMGRKYNKYVSKSPNGAFGLMGLGNVSGSSLDLNVKNFND